MANGIGVGNSPPIHESPFRKVLGIPVKSVMMGAFHIFSNKILQGSDLVPVRKNSSLVL